MTKLELSYTVEHAEGLPDVYLFALDGLSDEILTCLIVDSAKTLGERYDMHATDVLVRLVADFFKMVAAEAAENN